LTSCCRDGTLRDDDDDVSGVENEMTASTCMYSRLSRVAAFGNMYSVSDSVEIRCQLANDAVRYRVTSFNQIGGDLEVLKARGNGQHLSHFRRSTRAELGSALGLVGA
jgi:hypothetical protein